MAESIKVARCKHGVPFAGAIYTVGDPRSEGEALLAVSATDNFEYAVTDEETCTLGRCDECGFPGARP